MVKIKKFDVVVIGGGPSGMASAIEAYKNGSSVALIERENKLGGILKQCIHSGFGLHYFGEEMTGPEYAHRFIEELEETGVEVYLSSFVVSIKPNEVIIKNSNGIETIKCGAIILSVGCRERTAGAISMNGERPSGVWTAGQVQKWVNMYGKLPCKNPIILGSGDIGLIMARRLTLEGAKPQMVLELMSTTSGLKRNISQCLVDYNIPLYLNTTVVEVLGYPKITGVVIANVDEKLQVIESTKRTVSCDGLVLSVGLIPETTLLPDAKINPKTGSYLVNEYYETSVKGVFACGNGLHVHDLVDFVTKESKKTGFQASEYSKGKLIYSTEHQISAGKGVRYTVPNSFFEGVGKVEILFRVTGKFTKTNLQVLDSNGNVLSKKFVLCANAGEMQSIEFEKTNVKTDIQVVVEGAN